MSFSLNEVEATAKRATRGAGYSWGLAEEAAKATRWLCARSHDGVWELAVLLEAGYGASSASHAPKDISKIWQCPGDLCALITGACLSDCAELLTDSGVQMRRVLSPSLLLPFAACVARRVEVTVSVLCGGVVAVTDGTGLEAAKDFPTIAQDVSVVVGGEITSPRPILTRATPDASAWETLNNFAHLTYAPATEESRLLGAGAGLSDND